jgi:hypothetical protein
MKNARRDGLATGVGEVWANYSGFGCGFLGKPFARDQCRRCRAEQQDHRRGRHRRRMTAVVAATMAATVTPAAAMAAVARREAVAA